jgi:hypothetical protein
VGGLAPKWSWLWRVVVGVGRHQKSCDCTHMHIPLTTHNHLIDDFSAQLFEGPVEVTALVRALSQ